MLDSKSKGNNWFHHNASSIGRLVEILFGIVWGIDGFLKLQPSFAQNFSQLIANSASGQPHWLSGWFSFWAGATSANLGFFALMIAVLEISLFVSLTFGFLRKLAYGGGLVFSLMVWSIPEGFGGPYGPSSTDIGTAIIYAIVFLLLIVISATYGTNKYTIDNYIEKRLKWWKMLAEVKY